MEDLSNKEKQILIFLQNEVKTKGYPPSVREICKETELRSTSTVHGYLEKLERKGYIKRDSLKPRAIEILWKEENEIKRELSYVPVVGKVTAGEPILAVQNIEEYFPIPLDYIHNDDVFMLKVQGDSMIEAGILSNDLILVKKQETADNGDIVVAMLDDSATVKRFYKEKDHIRLQPENSAMSPIIVHDATILGKVTGLFRKI